MHHLWVDAHRVWGGFVWPLEPAEGLIWLEKFIPAETSLTGLTCSWLTELTFVGEVEEMLSCPQSVRTDPFAPILFFSQSLTFPIISRELNPSLLEGLINPDRRCSSHLVPSVWAQNNASSVELDAETKTRMFSMFWQVVSQELSVSRH